MPGEEKINDWYTNKDLFKMISDLKDELVETRMQVKKYNGLRKDMNNAFEQLNEIYSRINEIEQRRYAHANVCENIRNWGGWLIALATLILYLTEVVL